MATTTRKHPPVKTSRFVKVLSRFDADGKNAEIEITMTRGKKVEIFRYWIDRIASDFGTAFHVEKHGDGIQENEEYHVNLSGAESICDCKGFSRWSKCKHVDSLKKLMELGKL